MSAPVHTQDEAAKLDSGSPATRGVRFGPSHRLSRLFTILAILVAPPAVFFGLRVTPFFMQNGVDPFIYVGYQQSLPDLIERFGYAYYFPVRFGMLLPLRFASLAFGAIPGFFVARYVLALVVVVALYALGRSNGSRAAGWLGAMACLCSPVFLGALMTVYADTVALPCMIGGIVLLLLPAVGFQPKRAALAGLLFGVALNANLFVGPLLIAAFACRAVLHVIRREWFAFLDWVIVALGVLAVTAAGMVYYGLSFGDADVLGPSIDAARMYSGDGGLIFRSPTRDWLTFSPHLYIPAVVGLALFLLVMTRRRSPEGSKVMAWLRPGSADALVMLAGAQLFFVLHQFILDGYSMEAYYYYSYMWPFVAIALVFVMVELAARRGCGSAGVWAAVAFAAITPIVHGIWLQDVELWPSSAVPFIAGGVALSLLVAKFVPSATLVGCVGLMVGVSMLALAPPRDVPLSPGQDFRWDPHYERMTWVNDRTGLDIYGAAAELANLVPTSAEDPGDTIYWYRTNNPILSSVQSAGLYRYTTLDAGAAGLPVLTNHERALLTSRTPRHVVVLASTEDDLDLAQRALGKVIAPESTKRSVVGSGVALVHVDILTYKPANCGDTWQPGKPWGTQTVCP